MAAVPAKPAQTDLARASHPHAAAPLARCRYARDEVLSADACWNCHEHKASADVRPLEAGQGGQRMVH